MAYVMTDETGRITAVSEEFHCGDDELELELPEGFDIDAHRDYRLVDGELVHDPMPEPAYVRIAMLKERLAETDYVVVKLMEASLGKASIDQADAERYDGIISDRQAWRDEINALEGGE